MAVYSLSFCVANKIMLATTLITGVKISTKIPRYIYAYGFKLIKLEYILLNVILDISTILSGNIKELIIPKSMKIADIITPIRITVPI